MVEPIPFFFLRDIGICQFSLKNTSPSSYNLPKGISSLSFVVAIHSSKGRSRWEGEVSGRVEFNVSLWEERSSILH